MTDIRDAVVGAVLQGVREAAADPSNNTTPSDVGSVTREVVKQVGPIVDHLTNQEPWYQSRVTWGVIIAALSTIAKPFAGDLLDLDPAKTADIVNALATAGQGVGFLLTLYGRWKAKKPLGE